MRINELILIILLLLSSPLLVAQDSGDDETAESNKLAVEDVVAFVQYVDGDVELDEPDGRKKELSFKRLLYLGDSFSVPDDDLIKLRTIQGCTIVFYGPVTVTAPIKSGAHWSVGDGVFRWVCPAGKTQSFEARGQKIELFEGELFVNRDQLMFFEGAGRIESSVVVADVLHKFTGNKDNGTWESANLNYDLKELKEDWDDDFPVPREVQRTEIKNESLDKYTWHFGAGPSFGYGVVQLTSEVDEQLDRGTGGTLLWLAKDFDSFTLYGSVNSMEFESYDQPLEGDFRSEYLDLQFQAELLSVGMMKPAGASFAYLAAAGIGVSELEVFLSNRNPGSSDGFEYSRHEHTLIALSGGAMKRFFDQQFFYGWASLNFTIFYGIYSATYEGDPNNVPNLYGGFLTLSLGPGFQF